MKKEKLERVKSLLKTIEVIDFIKTVGIESINTLDYISYGNYYRSNYDNRLYGDKEEFLETFRDLDTSMKHNKQELLNYISWTLCNENINLFEEEYIVYFDGNFEDVYQCYNEKQMNYLIDLIIQLKQLANEVNLDFIDFDELWNKTRQDIANNDYNEHIFYNEYVDIIFNKEFLELELNNKNNLNKKVNKV